MATAAHSTGARGEHLMAVAVRMRWSGQGFGDLLIKSGVAWIIELPEGVKLAFGVGAQELCPRVPTEAEPRDRMENLATEYQAESANICLL